MDGIAREFLFYLFILFAFLSSCKDDDLGSIEVITENVIFVSSQRIIVSGRIISLSNSTADDHGFYIDSNENFSSPLIFSLGERNSLGKFITEISKLQFETDYYLKAFVKKGESIYFGNVLNTLTFSPKVNSFHPKIGSEGEYLDIFGSNFSRNVEVFFDDIKAEIVEVTDVDSRIRVIIPPPENALTNIKVVFEEGKEEEFDEPFEYITGNWLESQLLFPVPELFGHIYFKRNNDLFIGFGNSIGSQINPNIWKAQIDEWNWEEILFSGTAPNGAFFSNGFFGGGRSSKFYQVNSFIEEFWTLSENFSQLGIIPFDRYNSIGFKIGNYFYVLGGYDFDNNISNLIFRYDFTLSQWENFGTTPFLMDGDITNFTYSNKQYFILPDRNIWTFDPLSLQWVIEAQYPSVTSKNGIAVVQNDRVFIGLFENRSVIREFYPDSNTWKIKNPFPGNFRTENIGAFDYDGSVYILRQLPGSGDGISLWILNPDHLN